MLKYTLIRSRRKTAAIYIRPDATVEVRAPSGMPKAAIDRFVSDKESWITQRLTLMEGRNREKAGFTLDYGVTIPLCGAEYPIRAETANRAGFDGECFFIPPNLPQEHIRLAVIAVYKLLAKRILTEKAAFYASKMGVSPAAVKINSAKTRWGSCSGKNSVNFSWRLVMADEDAVDYVVVHELAHISEHNHSPRFWAIVEGVMPDYPQRKDKLKALQDKLSRESWD